MSALNCPLRRAGFSAVAILFPVLAALAAEPPTHEIDFCQATGISTQRLAELTDSALKTGLPYFPLAMIVRTADGKCLVDAKVKVSWDGGSQMHTVPWTGQIVFPLNRDRVKGLRVSVPLEYSRLAQTSFAEGASYQPPADFSYFNVEVANDFQIKTSIQRRLVEIRREGKHTPMSVLGEQLKRNRCTLELMPSAGKPMTPAEIYRQLRPTVVVMAGLSKAGQMRAASGVVIAPAGIVATNYHVMAHQSDATEVIGAMLVDGRVCPVREVLAADRATDVAIVRIEADHLAAAPLSLGEPIGAPVTIIAHPDQRFWFLTHGCICRYGRAMYAGEERAYMEVSAEFMPGSSGGPAFSADGAVAGIVSTIAQTTKGMVFKQCIPVQSIRRLIQTPAESKRPAKP